MMESNKTNQIDKVKPVIGITIGDINGIGPEIIIKTLRDPRILNYVTPVVLGSTSTLSYYRKFLHIDCILDRLISLPEYFGLHD